LFTVALDSHSGWCPLKLSPSKYGLLLSSMASISSVSQLALGMSGSLIRLLV
jgi:hypothetical protein